MFFSIFFWNREAQLAQLFSFSGCITGNTNGEVQWKSLGNCRLGASCAACVQVVYWGQIVWKEAWIAEVNAGFTSVCRHRKKAVVIKDLYHISSFVVAISYLGVIHIRVMTLVRVKMWGKKMWRTHFLLASP